MYIAKNQLQMDWLETPSKNVSIAFDIVYLLLIFYMPLKKVSMGNTHSSLEIFNPSHINIYKKLLQIQDPGTRVQMIQTLLAGHEYAQAARMAGVYSHLLAYVARVNAREKPAPLPGEQQVRQAELPSTQIQTFKRSSLETLKPSAYVAKGRSNEKALNYFQNCLLVLGLEEEVALTEEYLRSAYKKAAVRTHPDKGGSEQEFEAVTRAYAYLTDILRRINGGRAKEGVVEAPTHLKDSRQNDSKDWEMIDPVRLNPKKLDLNAFNTMFEKTRIPDPDEEGYGDWLKTADGPAKGPTFGGNFNRDVFNRTFESEAKKQGSSAALTVTVPQAMVLAPTYGVEIGRGASGDYTAPAGGQMKYTDLRRAYTTDNTFSSQVAGVQVDTRSFDTYSESRKRAPVPLNNSEMEAIQDAEKFQERRENERKLRAAQELVQADEYFKRMKQVVLTDGQSLRKSDRFKP